MQHCPQQAGTTFLCPQLHSLDFFINRKAMESSLGCCQLDCTQPLPELYVWQPLLPFSIVWAAHCMVATGSSVHMQFKEFFEKERGCVLCCTTIVWVTEPCKHQYSLLEVNKPWGLIL